MTTMQTVTPRNPLDPTPRERPVLPPADIKLIVELLRQLWDIEAAIARDERRPAKTRRRGKYKTVVCLEKVLAQRDRNRVRAAEQQRARRARRAAERQRTPARAGVNQCPATARTRGGRGLRRAA